MDWPLRYAGRNFHCLTASTAYRRVRVRLREPSECLPAVIRIDSQAQCDRALEPGFPGFVRIVRLHPVHKNGRRRMIRNNIGARRMWLRFHGWLSAPIIVQPHVFSNIHTPEARDCPRLNPPFCGGALPRPWRRFWKGMGSGNGHRTIIFGIQVSSRSGKTGMFVSCAGKRLPVTHSANLVELPRPAGGRRTGIVAKLKVGRVDVIDHVAASADVLFRENGAAQLPAVLGV
jgi:hypothetical protein